MSDFQPKISVITCTYKVKENYLRKSLQSIEHQTYKNIEHIFNDSSNDPRTLKIIADYTERNKEKYTVKLIQSQPKGVANALNTAYPHATGDLVHFLHSDDYYFTHNALEKVAHFFRENPGATWLTGNFAVSLEGKTLKFPITKVLSLSPRRILSTMIWISHENTFMKTELLSRYGGFNEGVKGPVEYRLWLRMIRDQKLHTVNDYFTCSHIHKGSTSRGNAKAIFVSLAECLKTLHREKIIFGIGHREDTTAYKTLKAISGNAKIVLRKLG